MFLTEPFRISFEDPRTVGLVGVVVDINELKDPFGGRLILLNYCLFLFPWLHQFMISNSDAIIKNYLNVYKYSSESSNSS